MSKLYFSDGYNEFDLEITQEEKKLIKNKKPFQKKDQIPTEDEEDGLVEATWVFNPNEDTVYIYCENGAEFISHNYFLD